MDWIKTTRNNNNIVCFHLKIKRSVMELNHHKRICSPPHNHSDNRPFCGERGIRTPGTLSGTSDFKSGALNRSAISPEKSQLFNSFCFVVYYKIKMRFVFSTTLKIVELTSPVNKLLQCKFSIIYT